MGRKRGITHNEQRLRSHLAAALRQKFSDKRGAAAQAANATGMTRQSISLYLHEKATPSAEALRRICTALDLTLEIDGAVITPEKESIVTTISAQQLDIFTAINAVQDHQLTVKILSRKSESIELKVSIDFSDSPREQDQPKQ